VDLEFFGHGVGWAFGLCINAQTRRSGWRGRGGGLRRATATPAPAPCTGPAA
jgi:hypothetical protein